MSVLFTASNSQVVTCTAASVDLFTGPYTVAGWYNRSSSGTSARRTIAAQYPQNNSGWRLFWSSYSDPRELNFEVRGREGIIIDAGGEGAWQHACGVYDVANNDVLVYLNGTKGTDGNSLSAIDPATDDVTFGGTEKGSFNEYFDGRLEHIAIWNGVVLTPGEIAGLAGGVHPLRIRPESLLMYVPLWTPSHINGTPGFAGTFGGSGSLAQGVGAPVRPMTFRSSGVFPSGAAPPADPEGPLVGGKLVGGGILQGRLVR